MSSHHDLVFSKVILMRSSATFYANLAFCRLCGIHAARAAFVTLLLLCAPAGAQPAVSLTLPREAWKFDNGREFPGATGGLTIDPTAARDGKESLKLVGDFTKGGNYVQAGRSLDNDIRILRMWLRNPDAEQLTLRIVDASGQCHQLKLKTQLSPDWQQLTFPLAEFFARKGSPDAVPTVLKYENWGGAKDARWHGPAKGMFILLGRKGEQKTVAMWLNDVTIVEPPRTAGSSQGGEIATLLPVEMVAEGEPEWRFDNGQEFPGAKGSLTVVNDQPEKGQACLKLAGDFNKGGAYVECIKDLKPLEISDVRGIRLRIKSDNARFITLRMGDGTGQCHQHKAVKITNDGGWHDLVLKISEIAGGEHWGGTNDGKWHGSPAYLSIILGAGADEKKQPVLYLAGVALDAVQPAVVQAATFQAGFEGADQLPEGWTTQGTVRIDGKEAFQGKQSLLLSREATHEDTPCSGTSPAFRVVPGVWEIALAAKSDLVSPDSSYQGIVLLEEMDASGKVLNSVSLAELFKQRNWQAVNKRLEMPAGAATARFRMELRKTSGNFWVDELSASYVAAAPRKDKRVAAVLFATAQLGNMLLPDDKRVVDVTVRATKPLRESQRELSYVVRDYWGAEQIPAGKTALTKSAKKGNWIEYDASIDLSGAPLEVGRYYEVHAEVPQQNDLPFHNYTSLAILPEAVTKKYKPEEIPFTGRDWDNRPKDRFILADRIGIRICGVWGGWSGDPPYRPEAPSIEMCQKLGMGVVTGSPTHAIEGHLKGYEKYDEKALRQGVCHWIEKYGKIRPLIIDLGNEPHGDDARVQESIRAYRIVYNEVKKIDSSIMVLGTSCGPEERYFKYGFQDCCDAYDFHIYESYADVGRAIESYRTLFAKYGGAKPIWSTELGLNAQGMTRHAVAVEMIKKFTVFFAAGGANVSWFDLMYPDSAGTNGDSNGSAFNVFDCRYCRYAPKLDAVTYYNMVNAICIKKFVEQKHYAGGLNAYLFRDRDGQCLQVLWADKGRADVGVPLAGVDSVLAIGIDGRRTEMKAGAAGGLTLSVSEDPVVLLYKSSAGLADAIAPPRASLAAIPAAMIKGAAVPLAVSLNGLSPDRIKLLVPPFWTATRSAGQPDASGATRITFNIATPLVSEVRQGELLLAIQDEAGSVCGQLSALVSVAGRLTVKILPEPALGDKPAGAKLLVKNNGSDKQEFSWQLALLSETPIVDGIYGKATPAAAFFASAADGAASVDPAAETAIVVPLSGIDPLTVYRVKATVTDASGRTVESQRNVAGFVAVPKAAAALKLDGSLDEAAWKNCPVQRINEARQYRIITPGDPQKVKWNGPRDLSATVRFLWDDRYLYLGVDVTERVFNNPMADDMLWGQDGLQMIVDPARSETEKPGKYDYALGLSHTSGTGKAWCHLSGNAATSTGEVKDIVVATRRAADGSGGMTYEIAIPWSRLAPFRPAAGANLGLTVTLNEDNGKGGRHSIMGWFGDVQSKAVDFVGDLILQP
jgi:hypothetical protein